MYITIIRLRKLFNVRYKVSPKEESIHLAFLIIFPLLISLGVVFVEKVRRRQFKLLMFFLFQEKVWCSRVLPYLELWLLLLLPIIITIILDIIIFRIANKYTRSIVEKQKRSVIKVSISHLSSICI